MRATATSLLHGALVLLLYSGGCASSPELEPPPNAAAATANRVSKRTNGVEVTAQVDAWTGWPAIKTLVTPLHLTIDNESESWLAVSYQSFSLASDGARFEAMPPSTITGTVKKPVLVERRHEGEGLARREVEVALPTPEMLDVALLEGVLEPGGVVSGFVYFEKVNPELDRVFFEVELADSDTGETRVEMSVPFLVGR